VGTGQTEKLRHRLRATAATYPNQGSGVEKESSLRLQGRSQWRWRQSFCGGNARQDGDVFGTTLAGGLYSYGTAYDLFNFFDGSYGEAILASVADAGGITPYGGVILDSAGNVYGTTAYGGTYNLGIVYEVTNN